MTKIRQFFFTLHKSSQDEKLQAVEYCRTLKPNWFMVALEPYLDKEGSHLHIMFQLKNPRSPQAVKADVMKRFSKSSSDCFQQAGKGRFSDNKNYIICETAGEHKDDPKVLDPEPIIWPEDYQEEAPRRSDADSVIEDIRNGATLSQLLNTYPKYVLNNLSKIKNFMVEAKKSDFIRPQMAIIRGVPVRVSAPWE